MKDNIELQAMPGRKVARADMPDEWIVSGVAGRVGPLGRQPTIPIASFFGPQAEYDANLFAGASTVFHALRGMELLVNEMAETAAKATGDQLRLRDDPEVDHMLCMAKAARMFCCGFAAALVSFTANGVRFDGVMPLHEIMECAGREGFHMMTIDRVNVAPLSDQFISPPQTIGEATNAAPLPGEMPQQDQQPAPEQQDHAAYLPTKADIRPD